MNTNADDNEPCWLIDASIYVFRAWFALPGDLCDRDGNTVNAVIGFINFVNQLLTNEKPQLIAFAFDESLRAGHRQAIYPAYKANRETAPENLRYQFALCRRFLRLAGIVEAASDSFEADDLIGTWARMQQAQQRPVYLISADKDLAQLISEQDVLWDYSRNKRLDYRGVNKQFGLRPDQIAEQLAIAGDKVDNIPGVPGIGMATAARLLRKFETIDHMLASIAEIGKMKFRGASRVQQQVDEYQEQIRLYRQITPVVCNVPGIYMELERNEPNRQGLLQFYDFLNYQPVQPVA